MGYGLTNKDKNEIKQQLENIDLILDEIVVKDLSKIQFKMLDKFFDFTKSFIDNSFNNLKKISENQTKIERFL